MEKRDLGEKGRKRYPLIFNHGSQVYFGDMKTLKSGLPPKVKKGLRVRSQVQKKWGPFLFGEGKAMGGRASRPY
jgi:hypothetical protein